jgi:phage terminase large subunit GpA-like protein
MISSGVQKAIQLGLEAGIPDSTMSVSAWAEMYRYVDRGARKGKWSNDTVPYLTEIMDAFTDPRVREIVFQKPSQSGGSEVIMNCIGRTIHLEPTEMAYVGEKEDKAKGWTQESFDATVRTTDVLDRLVSKDAEFNNQKVKAFPGGCLFIIWASSPAELSSRPLQHLFLDEKAAYVPTKEGDAVKLGEARTKTYSGHEKIVKVSSPRNADDESDIEKDFTRGDQREFFVPCPQCGEFQTLKWANVKWDDDSDVQPYMVCDPNGCLIENEDLQEMLLKGRWVASAPFSGIASFKINQLYSPFVPWRQMALDLIDAKHSGSKGALQVWVNTALAEPWKPEERIEYADLQLSREDYAAPVPAGVLLLTFAVDVQGDRLEIEVKGWGRDHENWSIDYRVIYGSPALPAVWDDLVDYLTQTWEGELPSPTSKDGLFRLSAGVIDTGDGNHTEQIYKFIHANTGRRWYAIKGSSMATAPLINKPSIVGKVRKVRLFSVGTNTAKDEVFAYLRVKEPGPGFCHFPADDRYGDDYIKQLCSEKKVPRFRRGQSVHVYEKVSANARNEALDLFVYNIAAREILNPNYEKLAKRRRLGHVDDAEPPNAAEMDDAVPAKEAAEAPQKKGRIRVKNNPFSGYKL